jgi:hypothetical protein
VDESDELGCYTNRTAPQAAGNSEYSCEKNGSLLCEHNCTDLNELAGFVCSCHHGFKMVKLNISETPSGDQATATEFRKHSCVDIDECESYSSHCSQICLNLKGSYQCKCAENYIDSHGDGSVCEAAWNEDSVVLVAYGSEIRQLRQNFTDYSYTTIIENENSVSSIDVDPIERVLYWIDEASNRIKRSYIPVSRNALGRAQPLMQSNERSALNSSETRITALAVDWLAKNVYFIQGRSIKVSKLDGRYVKTLISQQVTSQSIQVNPIIGLGVFKFFKLK